MTDPAQIAAGGCPGELQRDSVAMALRVHSAIKHGRGCRLTADQCAALSAIMGDGDWWTGVGDNISAVRAILQAQEGK